MTFSFSEWKPTGRTEILSSVQSVALIEKMEIKSKDHDRFVRVLEFNREKKIHFAWWMTNFVAIDILRREKIGIFSRATWISKSVPSISSFSMFVSLMTQFGANSAISYFIILSYANEPAPKSIFLLSHSVSADYLLSWGLIAPHL